MAKEFWLPKNERDLKDMLINAFMAGCNHAYIVEHAVNLTQQEMLGAKLYVGDISEDDFYSELVRLQKDSDEGDVSYE